MSQPRRSDLIFCIDACTEGEHAMSWPVTQSERSTHVQSEICVGVVCGSTSGRLFSVVRGSFGSIALFTTCQKAGSKTATHE